MVALGDVDDIRLKDDGADLDGRGELGDDGDGSVAAEVVLVGGDGEAEDPAHIIEVEVLDAGASGEARDDADLAEVPRAEVVASFGVRAEGAAVDEVLVGLRTVEVADDGPDNDGRPMDALREEGGALAQPHDVAVLRLHRVHEAGEEGGVDEVRHELRPLRDGAGRYPRNGDDEGPLEEEKVIVEADLGNLQEAKEVLLDEANLGNLPKGRGTGGSATAAAAVRMPW